MCLYSNPLSSVFFHLLSHGDFVFKLEQRYLEVEDYALNTGWVSVSQGSGWAKLRETLNTETRRQITVLSLSLSCLSPFFSFHNHQATNIIRPPELWLNLQRTMATYGSKYRSVLQTERRSHETDPGWLFCCSACMCRELKARKNWALPLSFTYYCEGLAPPWRPLPSLWLPNHIYKLTSIILVVATDNLALLECKDKGPSPWVSSDKSLVMGEVEVTQVACSTETISH